MRFALLGDHADGLGVARALAASGRHALVTYSGPAAGLSVLERDGLQPRRVGDLEEVLADPDIEAVIVAGGSSLRAGQLRRALQSERHVLCVHPVDPSPDIAYEAALLRSDARRVLLPLLPEALHPGIQRLAEILHALRGPSDAKEPIVSSEQLPPGFPRLLEWERWSSEECLLNWEEDEDRPGVPGWDVLRLLGGELAEVFALAMPEYLGPGEPLVLSGRFVHGGLWKTTLLPRQRQPYWRLGLVGGIGSTELIFPQGFPGPARLKHLDEAGQEQTMEWPALHPWAPLVETFDAAVEEWRLQRRLTLPGATETTSLTDEPGRLGWQDAIRALELDDAVRRSVERRRAISLEVQEATEEASFKGAMTLVGCGLLWLSLLLLILSVWMPRLGWVILPIIGVFMALQVLRWIVPKARSQESGVRSQESGDQESEVRSPRSEVGNQETGIKTQESRVKSPE